MPRRARLIAFSVWGREPRYLAGAIRNAELAKGLYPGWTCRFYVASSVPASLVMRLAALPNTEIVGVRDAGDWRALFWRFFPASEEAVEVLLVRDADSRLSPRERDAVSDWLASGKDFHIMRDHPFHDAPILGGMWGVRRGLLRNIRALIAAFPAANRWQTDQDFLRSRVFPLVRDRAVVHDEFFGGHPFPSPRRGLEFVGQAFDEHDRPLHEEHMTVLASLTRPGEAPTPGRERRDERNQSHVAPAR